MRTQEEWRKEVCRYNISLFKLYMGKIEEGDDRQWCREVIDRYQIELNVLDGVGGKLVFF